MKMSGLINDMLEEMENIADEEIPLPTITSVVLRDILDYCEHFKFDKEQKIPFPLPSNTL